MEALLSVCASKLIGLDVLVSLIILEQPPSYYFKCSQEHSEFAGMIGREGSTTSFIRRDLEVVSLFSISLQGRQAPRVMIRSPGHSQTCLHPPASLFQRPTSRPPPPQTVVTGRLWVPASLEFRSVGMADISALVVLCLCQGC